MAIKSAKEYRRKRIKFRIRKVISGTAERPRMTVFRSNKQIYVQLVDDLQGQTLASASSKVKSIFEKTAPHIDKAKMVGALIAERAIEAGITEVVFDRNGYLYHGRIKALAESARENGLKF